ncbi:MAG TPA: hypothetical protein VI030_03300 [Propionibacteriaceae bacterium]
MAAEQIVLGITGEPAWPTVRTHLLLVAAHGIDPVAQLQAAASSGELNSAEDRAAVVDWRLDDTGHRNTGRVRCPGSPASPRPSHSRRFQFAPARNPCLKLGGRRSTLVAIDLPGCGWSADVLR